MLKITINNFNLTLKLTTVLMILLMIALGYLEQFFILYFFIIIHELIHIITAGIFGKRCRGIIIMPVGLCAEIEGVEDMELMKRNIVVLSAPFFNMGAGILLRGSFEGSANILIGILNLLPVYPLDGARFFQNVTGYFIGTLRANKLLVILNKVIVYILFFIGLLQVILFDFNFTVIIAAMYIYREEKRFGINRTYYFYKCLVKSKTRKPIRVRMWFADENIILKDILYKFGMDYYTMIWTGKRLVEENRVKEYISKYGLNSTLKETGDGM